MTWSVKPLSPAFGAEIGGADLRQSLSETQSAQLRQLLDAHSLILFRGQNLSAEDQVRVLGSFGRVSDEQGDGVQHTYVSNVRAGGLFGDWPLPFHQDYGSFQPVIAPAISLYGYELEGESMPTQFASLVRGCAMLPKDLRARLENMTAVHAVDLNVDTGTLGYENRARLLELPVMPPESTHPRQTHPVIKPHPRTGAPMLFLSEMHLSHIEGCDSAASEALIQQLFALLYREDNIYSHHWSAGDLLIWDNIATQHGRRPAVGAVKQQRRTLRRVVVCDQNTREIFKNIKYNNSKGFQSAKAYS